MFGLFGKKDAAGKGTRASSAGVSPIPLTAFDGHLRCIKREEIANDPLANEAMSMVCRKFFGRDIVDPKTIESDRIWAERHGITFTEQEKPFTYRRFAGDSTLERGSYYSVCMNEDGWDNGTLESELGAYSELAGFGMASVRDINLFDAGETIYFFRSFDPRNAKPLWEAAQQRRGGLIFHFNFRAGVPRRLFDSDYIYADAARRSEDEYAVFVPTVVQRTKIEKCFDLRLPASRAWLMQRLDQGLPGLVTVDANSQPVPFDVNRKVNLTDEQRAALLMGYDTGGAWCAPNYRWDGKPLSLPPGLPRLIAYLGYPVLGGSPITDAIGRYLRLHGAEAMIFPSCRSDVEVEVRKGALKSWSGWNLVDFRKSPPPHRRPVVVVEPQSWATGGSGETLAQPPSGHETAGSFRWEGRKAALHAYLLEQSRIY